MYQVYSHYKVSLIYVSEEQFYDIQSPKKKIIVYISYFNLRLY